MAVSPVFGAILAGDLVEQAALTLLQDYFTTYLGELERQRDLEPMALPPPRSYTIAEEIENWPEDQLPCVVIVSPGLAGAPSRRGQGTYDAVYELRVAVVCSAATQADTNRLAHLYSAAVVACLVQHRSLGDVAAGLHWLDFGKVVELDAKRRSLAAAVASFAVQMENIVSTDGPVGPPPEDPYVAPEPWPQVETVVTETERT